MKPLITFIAGAIVSVGIFLVGQGTALQDNLGGAAEGVPAIQSVATTTQVGPQETVQLFAARSDCSARVVGTVGREITLIFADPSNGDVSSTTLSAIVGFVQAASTTKAYNHADFGCGRVFGYSAASTTITTADMR